MTNITLAREDINNPLHPALWEQICETLGVSTDSDQVELRVASAVSDVAED